MVTADYTLTKTCKTCQLDKAWSEFHLWPSTGKPRASCKDCSNAARRKGTARKMEFTETGKICTQCGKDKPLSEYKLKSKQSGLYRSACKACNYLATLSWNERNRDRVCLHTSTWKRKCPDRVYEHKSTRRASKNGVGGTHSAADIARLLKLQKHRCAYCRCSIRKSRHIDHIVPLKLGGSNDWTNLQALCPTCNLKKGAKDPTQYANKLGLLL